MKKTDRIDWERNRYVPFVIAHCKRSRELEEKFREFNGDFFNSKLTRYQVRLCTKCKSFGHEIGGYCLTSKKMILIRAGLGRKSTEQILIHEMVHAKLSRSKKKDVHGKAFLSELRRLRKLGAPLSDRELDKIPRQDKRSREPPRFSKKIVFEILREAIVVERLPPRMIPSFLERELMIPYSVISSRVDVDDEVKRLGGAAPASALMTSTIRGDM